MWPLLCPISVSSWQSFGAVTPTPHFQNHRKGCFFLQNVSRMHIAKQDGRFLILRLFSSRSLPIPATCQVLLIHSYFVHWSMADDIQEHLLHYPLEGEIAETHEQQQALDCWGRPSTSKLSLGGWKAANLLIGANTLICLAFSGCTVNLVLFLVRVLKQDNAFAANMVTNWVGTTHLTSLIGASIGDAYMGRLLTSIICQVFFITGLFLYAFSGGLLCPNSSPLGPMEAPPSHTENTHALLFYISLYIMGVGSASLAPNMLSLGGDQFDCSKEKSKFINLLMGSSSIGMLFSTTLLSYWEDTGNWVLGFWISAVSGLLGFLLFLASMPIARQFKSGNSTLSCIFKVIVSSIKARDSRTRLWWLHETNLSVPTRVSVSQGSEEAQKQIKQKMCSIDMEVQEVKSMCRLLPFWLCGIMATTAMSQKGTLFVLQGATMDRRVGTANFDMPPSSMSIFSILTVVTGAPAYTWVFLPCIQKTIGKEFTVIHRMGAGLALAIASFSTAALVEACRLKVAELHGDATLEGPLLESHVPMSIFWLVPQYVLEGWSVVFFAFGHLEFNYSSAPKSMKSLATALSLSSLAFGSYISTVVIHIVTATTNWIPKNLNEGHLDYFYWLLAAMLVFTLATYLIFAWWNAKQAFDVQEEVLNND